jgi:hypothetical protein
MSGVIPPLPQYVFMAWCLVKHRGNFTFTITILQHSPENRSNSHRIFLMSEILPFPACNDLESLYALQLEIRK